MFNIGFFKALPTEYIIRYRAGRVVKVGPGLAFYYLRHNTQIVAVPTSSADGNFVFNEVTQNFQAVTIQGQFTYRITEPQVAAALLNFTMEPGRRSYLSDDPQRLPQRIANVIQMQTREAVQSRSLEDAIRDSQAIAAQVHGAIVAQGLLASLGVELLSVYFLAAKPAPEMSKALEAPYRESLLRRADEATYARRASAVEEERKIKQSELNTEVSLEEQRQQLIHLQAANALREAESRGHAYEMEESYRAGALQRELEIFKTMDARLVLALGLRDLGQNAEKIGNLNITPEILSALLQVQEQ